MPPRLDGDTAPTDDEEEATKCNARSSRDLFCGRDGHHEESVGGVALPPGGRLHAEARLPPVTRRAPSPRRGRLPCQGWCETTMAEVLGTMSQTAELNLAGSRGPPGSGGKLFVRMDEVEHQHDLVTLNLRAQQVRFSLRKHRHRRPATATRVAAPIGPGPSGSPAGRRSGWPAGRIPSRDWWCAAEVKTPR